MEFHFVTVWHIDAPIEAVCDIIYHSLNWPQWWLNVQSVVELAPGNEQGIGCVRRYTWRGLVPYLLTFDIRVIHMVPLSFIEGIASGDVEGNGCWSFAVEDAVTVVRYEWHVRITPKWMNLFAKFATPLIKWNHNSIMRRGGKALAHKLNARLIQTSHQ
jgi:hypothetical protein